MTSNSQSWAGNRAIDLLSIASFPQNHRASNQRDARSCKVGFHLNNKTEE
jgi:hypothetical protein